MSRNGTPAGRGPAPLVAVFLLGGLLFSFPLLALFNVGATVLGVPVLYAYLFAAWAALIVLIRAAVAKNTAGSKER